ncbi:MAG TPA: hypothetical protein VM186_03240 [Planctomycetota bacterium]|nr:hypothetical protein [Planctomycetota bacterium]
MQTETAVRSKKEIAETLFSLCRDIARIHCEREKPDDPICPLLMNESEDVQALVALTVMGIEGPWLGAFMRDAGWEDQRSEGAVARAREVLQSMATG